MQTPDEFYNTLARERRFGPSTVIGVQRVLAHTTFGRYVVFTPHRERDAVVSALRPLKDQLQGGSPRALGRALEVAASGLINLLPMRRVMQGESSSRAPSNEPGVVRAAMGLVAAADRLSGRIALPFNPDEVRFLVFLVGVGQGALGVLSKTEEEVDDMLAVWETRLLAQVREHYPYFAALAASDEAMAEALADTRQYLSASAAKAAIMRKANQRTLASLSAQAASAGQAAAESDARKAIAGQLKGIVEQALKPPVPTPDKGGERR